VSPATASEHLRLLVDGGLLSVERSGRHRYFRLASPWVGEALEALARLAPRQPVRSLRQARAAEALAEARSCYDHLAGRLGVAVFDGLVEAGTLLQRDGGLLVGDRAVLEGWGIDVEALLAMRRPVVRACLDWTERRHHLGGGLGAALLIALLERGWIERSLVPRALNLTSHGEEGLGAALPTVAVSFEGLAAPRRARAWARR
jgi:hypothetical protein